jgi:hypothetical protein
VALKRAVGFVFGVVGGRKFLASEAVQSAALSLQCINDIHGGDGLPFRVFTVGDSVSDDIFKEDLQDSPGFLINEAGNSLDTTSTGQTADRRFGDSLDVVPKDFPVALGTTLAKSLSSFSSSGHVEKSTETSKNRLTFNSAK